MKWSFLLLAALISSSAVATSTIDEQATLFCLDKESGVFIKVFKNNAWRGFLNYSAELSDEAGPDTQRLFQEFVARCAQGGREQQSIQVSYTLPSRAAYRASGAHAAAINWMQVNHNSNGQDSLQWPWTCNSLLSRRR